MTNGELVTLRKVLALERQKGCRDTAVVGGLDGFLARWLDRLPDQPPVRLPRPGYASMSADQRSRWLDDTLTLLDGEGASAAPAVQRTAAPRRRASGPPRTRQPRAKQEPSLASPLEVLPRVSSTVASRLKRLGVTTVRDLLYLFPRRHNDYGSLCRVADLTMEADQTVAVSVWEARETMLGGRMRSTEAVVGDETGNLRVVWFNQPHLARWFRPGTRLALSGRVTVFRDAPVMQSPEYEPLQSGENMIHTGGLVPVYPLTDGLTPRNLRRLVKAALDGWGSLLEDPLPEEMRRRTGLLPLAQAVRQAHYPQDAESQASARRRLAFDELFVMQMFVFSRRREWRESGGAPPLPRDQGVLDALSSRLPFSLTSAQDRALNEILADMEGERPMSRLLQGDVGSGKTVVALAALLSAVANDRQGAFMAPTEILAQQHFNTIRELVTGESAPTDGGPLLTFELPALPRPVSLGLLLGSQPARQKRGIQAMMSQGALDMVVGTHALLQQNADMPRLGLAVVDEQHRFGVMQRASLRHKGETPHLLVMSATPIPRSLALTLYGDLDLSILDEQPPGRKPIRTRNVPPERRLDAYEFVRRQVGSGRQAFVVCPLIEESEVLQTRAATTEFHRLSTEVFPDLTLGLLHGRLPLREKEEVMGRFQRGELDVLVSTPVVEVGIDNRNASVILIDGADRFGLAQLHQFRGRVGRGEHASYCMLMSDYPSAEAKERLDVMEQVSNGFAVAEEDLRFRGPGDYFGTRQSGLPDLRMARLSDQDLLSMARQEAADLLREDPALERPEHRALAQELARFTASSQHGEIS
ncbi:MAG: ATP-dependent DNA helicase RecG [Chloroflexota bacterium]|nr:ATP-dependent DNA helicase RecG [Chloroflexota bacterium]MDE3267896.1 ATP-dependent DNA helicase RecG [Chloroflexota bacterium]